MSMSDQYMMPNSASSAAAATYCQSAAGIRPRSRSAVLGALSPSEQRQLLDIQQQRRLGSDLTGNVKFGTAINEVEIGTTGNRFSTPSRMTDCPFTVDAALEMGSPIAKTEPAVRVRSNSGGVGVGHLPDQVQVELLLLAQLQQQRQQLMEYIAAKTVAASVHPELQRPVNSGHTVETEDFRSAMLLPQQLQPITAMTHSSTDRFKTELCRSYAESGGTCRYGDKCQFAHGPAELRSVERHPRYKTELCKTFHSRGFCAYGPRCHFIHNISETRLPPSALLDEALLHPEFYGAMILPQLVGGQLQTSGANAFSRTVPPLSGASSQHKQQPSWYGADVGTVPASIGQHRRFSLDNHLLTTSGLLAVQPAQQGFDLGSLAWQAPALTNPVNWAVGHPPAPFVTDDEKFRSRSTSLGSAASRSLYSESSGSSSPGPPSPPCTSGDIVDDLIQRAAAAEQVAAYLERYRRMNGSVRTPFFEGQTGPRLV